MNKRLKTLIVAGTWDMVGGRQSGLMNKFYDLLVEKGNYEITFFNGGHYSELSHIQDTAKEFEIIFWMAHVPNDLPKVRDVKRINPMAIVIGSKNGYDKEYSFVEVLNRALEQRNNLTILFLKSDERKEFKMLLFDPLGTSWYEGYELEDMADKLDDRLMFIKDTKRERTYKDISRDKINDGNEEFYVYIREVAEIFHKTIQHKEGVTRFLGNASYRGENGHIYVTERDVDKAYINEETIVESYIKDEEDGTRKVFYYGDKKPSKDTVVQTRLYEMMPNINYIVHSHCYAKDAVWTKMPVPCGSLDEVDEIVDAMSAYGNDYNKDYYKFNLKGHGCLILGKTLDDMKQTQYIIRQLPEKFMEV